MLTLHVMKKTVFEKNKDEINLFLTDYNDAGIACLSVSHRVLRNLHEKEIVQSITFEQ